jgi:ribosomal protein S2
MGVVFLKKLNLLKLTTNKKIKTNFYLTMCFFVNKVNISNILQKFLGKRHKFGIIRCENHIEMLKVTIKFLNSITQTEGSILFINDNLNIKFDGIIKLFSMRSGEIFYTGKWFGGGLTKKKDNLLYKTIIIFNSKKSYFLIKEVNLLGLPIINLCDINTLNATYPIICNFNGDSILYFSLIISNSIIEGKLFYFINNI